MFRNITLFVAASMAVLAAAAPSVEIAARDQCSTGAVQCCNSTHEANSSSLGLLKALLGLDLGDVTGQVGVTCSPLSVIGLSGTSCSQQTVCCTGNSFNGVVALGCTPININL